jgi:cytosine/adenosine deaminase-related metal-dependent hydrolase
MPNLRIKTSRLFDGNQLRTEPSLGIDIRGDRIDSILASGDDVIRSATRVNADLVNLRGQIGTIAAGACADLIGVSNNPIEDPRLLAQPEKHLKLVIRGGEIIVNRLPENLA